MTVFLLLRTMRSVGKAITHRILLGHMQTMQQTLTGQMQGIAKDVSQLKTDVSVLKTDVSTLKTDISTLKRQVAFLQGGVDSIDKRLDAIEIEQLPKRVKRLEANAPSR